MDPRRLKELELPRAFWHVCSISIWGVAALAVEGQWLGFFTKNVYVFIVWWAFALLLLWEGLRRRYDWFSRAPLVGVLLRKGERSAEYTTAVYFMLALLILVRTFDLTTVATAVFVTGCADPAARIVGKSLGKLRLPKSKKTIEGALGCFAVTLAIVWTLSGVGSVAVAAGLVVTAAELFIPGFLPGFLDDNFWIPILCALAIDWTPWVLKAVGVA